MRTKSALECGDIKQSISPPSEFRVPSVVRIVAERVLGPMKIGKSFSFPVLFQKYESC